MGCRLGASWPGQSPRARGHRHGAVAFCRRYGSIPAGTGTPGAQLAALPDGGVNPRGHGDTRIYGERDLAVLGQSPRARGHHGLICIYAIFVRSIPAGTGTPPTHRGGRPPRRVNPRGHGDTLEELKAQMSKAGQSPRARGHRGLCKKLFRRWGSIPAGTGTPTNPWRRRFGYRVNPRGHGDTRSMDFTKLIAGGQSPRARGHPCQC